VLKEHFGLNKGRTHILETMGKPAPVYKYGCPRIYIFSDVDPVISEIKQCIEDPATGKIKGNDHTITCLCFYTLRDRPYEGDYFGRQDE